MRIPLRRATGPWRWRAWRGDSWREASEKRTCQGITHESGKGLLNSSEPGRRKVEVTHDSKAVRTLPTRSDGLSPSNVFFQTQRSQARCCFTRRHSPATPARVTETEACIALNMVPGMGPVRLRQLLEIFETPQRV